MMKNQHLGHSMSEANNNIEQSNQSLQATDVPSA